MSKKGQNPEDSDPNVVKFCELKDIARTLISTKEYPEALQYYQEAFKIYQSEGLKKKIEKLKAHLKELSTEVNRVDLAKESSNNKNLRNEANPLPEVRQKERAHELSDNTRDNIHEDLNKPDANTVKYTDLIEVARILFSTQQYAEALQYYEEAYKIHQADRVKRKIEKIKAHLKDSVPDQVDEDNVPDLVDEEMGELADHNRYEVPDVDLDVPVFNSKCDKFQDLIGVASALFSSQEYSEALGYYQEAYKINQTDEIKRKIIEIKVHLEDTNLNPLQDSFTILVANGFSVDKELYHKLYPYQKEGVKWMLKLHKANKGGILADDMGLGKTVQVITFISGLIKSEMIKSALIVMPVSLITNWESEFTKWDCDFKVLTYHGVVKQKENNLARIQNRGGVLLTSYGTLVSAVDKLAKNVYGKKYIWDYIVLDEGHKIKNPTKTTKAAHEIKAFHRLVLSGTPLQNSLKELWALFDFCHQGTLLGNFTTFKLQYENAINRSREKDATMGEKVLGNKMAENLRTLIAPYFLRRTKADTIETKENVDPDDKNSCARLPRKNEFVVWLFLSDQQIDIYEKFLKSEEVKEILMTTKSPLMQLVVLKKICDHPRLFTKNACHKLSLDGSNTNESLNDSTKDTVSINVEPTLLFKESGKMQVLITLLENLRAEGHRTLVFSMSRKILDIIEKILKERHWKIMRLDGTVTKMSERQARINAFQSSANYAVFLLTTQVGGVGLTLTKADRVIIYDPSWNPANDAQAVDRAYRIGQEKDVVVYRFITCGTIEEKIYRRQIFKDSITRQATCSNSKQNNDPHRYFSKNELRELFVLDNPKESKTQEQLKRLHEKNRKATPELMAHVNFLLSLPNIYGISDHDLMFKGNLHEEIVVDDTVNPLLQVDYIDKQVEQAQQQLHLDSINNAKLAMQKGTYKTTYFVENKVITTTDFKPPLPKTDHLSYGNDYNEDYDAEVIDLEPILIEDVDEEDSLIKNISFDDFTSEKPARKVNFDTLNKSSDSGENIEKTKSENILKPKPLKSYFEQIAESQKYSKSEPEKSKLDKTRESNMLTPLRQNKKSPIPLITSFFSKSENMISTPKPGTSLDGLSSPDIFDSTFNSSPRNNVSSKIAECITIDSESDEENDCINLDSPKPGCSNSYLNLSELKPTVPEKRNVSLGNSQDDKTFINPWPKRKKFKLDLSDSD